MQEINAPPTPREAILRLDLLPRDRGRNCCKEHDHKGLLRVRVTARQWCEKVIHQQPCTIHVHATACKACVSRGSRNCQIKADAKRMQSSNAVRTMAARRFKKERKRGQTLKACPLLKVLKQKQPRGRRFNQD